MMDKQVWCIHNKRLLSNGRAKCGCMLKILLGEPPKYFKWQKSNARNHLLFNFIYSKCQKRGKYVKTKSKTGVISLLVKESHDYKWHKVIS